MSRSGYYKKGVKDGIPILLGYFAVSFAFGINAAAIGITPPEAALLSFMNLTSAGQMASLDVIAQAGSYLSMALLQFVVNLRYMLMSASLSQHVEPSLPVRWRLLMSFGLSDEIFALSAAAPVPLSPYYTIGLMSSAIPGWCLGTFLGALFGQILPERIISALSVAIYGMFLAIIIPEGKKSKAVALAIIAAMAGSTALSHLLPSVSSGNRLILITIAVAAAAAVLAPVKEEDHMQEIPAEDTR